MSDSSARRCLVAVCCNQPTVFRKTAQSLMELGWGNRVPDVRSEYGFEAIYHAWYTESPRVDALRDQALSDALRDDFSHLVFLDADMIWPTNVLMRLLAHHDRHGITAGLYVLKHKPFSPVHLTDQHVPEGSKTNMFLHPLDYGTELVEVDAVGMGCTLIPMSVVKAMGERPWFAYDDDDDGWPRVSEDVPFCLKAKALGFGIWMDPTIKCGHVGVQVYDEKWSKRWQKSVAETERRHAQAQVTERVT